MGIMNRFSSGVTNKVGNKVLNIEEIKEKVFCQQLKKKYERRAKAETIVKKKSLLSSGMSVVPIPGLDFGVDIKLMRDIIEDINKIYGLDHKQVNTLGDDVKERIHAIQGSSFIGKKCLVQCLK